MTTKFIETIQKLLQARYYDEAYQLFQEYYPRVKKDASILMMDRIFEIYIQEKEAGLRSLFLSAGTWETAISHYTNVKFLLRRIDFNLSESLQAEILQYIKQYQVSRPFLEVVLEASILNKRKVADFLDRMEYLC